MKTADKALDSVLFTFALTSASMNPDRDVVLLEILSDCLSSSWLKGFRPERSSSNPDSFLSSKTLCGIHSGERKMGRDVMSSVFEPPVCTPTKPKMH